MLKALPCSCVRIFDLRPRLSPSGVKPRSQNRSLSGAAAATSLLPLRAPQAPELVVPMRGGVPPTRPRDRRSLLPLLLLPCVRKLAD